MLVLICLLMSLKREPVGWYAELLPEVKQHGGKGTGLFKVQQCYDMSLKKPNHTLAARFS